MYNAEAILKKVKDRLTKGEGLTVEELQEMIGTSTAIYEAEVVLNKVRERLAYPEGITVEELQEIVGIPVIDDAKQPEKSSARSLLGPKVKHILRNLTPEAKAGLERLEIFHAKLAKRREREQLRKLNKRMK